MISAQLECETVGAEAFACNELQRNNVLGVGNVTCFLFGRALTPPEGHSFGDVLTWRTSDIPNL
jgi:hypothetical protein